MLWCLSERLLILIQERLKELHIMSLSWFHDHHCCQELIQVLSITLADFIKTLDDNTFVNSEILVIVNVIERLKQSCMDNCHSKGEYVAFLLVIDWVVFLSEHCLKEIGKAGGEIKHTNSFKRFKIFLLRLAILEVNMSQRGCCSIRI